MKLAILISQEPDKHLNYRLNQIFGHLEIPVIRLKNHPQFTDEADIYIYISRRDGLAQISEYCHFIKTIIGGKPLLLASEISSDPHTQGRITPALCDAFICNYRLETILEDLILLTDLVDIIKLPGITVNCKGEPLKSAPILPETTLFPAVLAEPHAGQKPDFSGFYPLISGLSTNQRPHHEATTSLHGFRRYLNHQTLLDQITYFVQNKKIRKFQFLDPAFNTELADRQEFAEKLLALQYGIEWKTDFTFSEIPADTIKLFKDSGLKEVYLTIFSASDRVLKANNIPVTRAIMRQNIQAFFAAGISISLKIYVGLPFEQMNDFFQIVDFIKELKFSLQNIIEIKSVHIEAGSHFHRELEKYGISLEPGEYAHWIKEEKDHLNDFQQRAAKKDFLMAEFNRMGLYNHDFPPQKTPFMQKAYENYRQSIVDVVLVTTPPWGYLNPPVGLAKLASYLDSRQKTCRVLDYNVGFYRKYQELERLWHVENKSFWSNDHSFEVIKYLYDSDIDAAVDEILDSPCRIIGFSCVDPKERITIEFIRRLREKASEIIILVGGQVCATENYRQVFVDKLGPDGVDFFAIGEGEETLLDIISKARISADFTKLKQTMEIAGTATVDQNGNWQYAASREHIDLKTLPITTYKEFNLADYDCRELIIEWSRGCIGNCNFCKARELDGALRTYSVDNVVESLKFYRDQYGITEFTVCDLAVNGNIINLERICDRLIAEVPDLTIKAEALPLRKMNENILKKMKDAGFAEIQWGVETGSDHVLELMGKKVFFTASDSQEVIRASYLSGIKTVMFCVVGYPGETEEDFQKTWDFIDRNAEYIDLVKSINSLHIITDTRVHREAKKLGILLPPTDYHYLWEMPDNNIETRRRRIQALLELIKIKNIGCLETNLLEGRQTTLFPAPAQEGFSIEKRVRQLREAINSLIDYNANLGEQPGQLSDPRAEFLRENSILLGVFHGKKAFHGPECVEIDLSNNCNYNCVGCWCHCDHLQELKTSTTKRKQHLPLDIIKLLINDLVELGTKTVQLAGPGEPFTHPDIMEIIRYIKGNGLELHIITNGSYIDFAVAEELCHLRVDLITVSIWAGTAEVFQQLHPNQPPERWLKLKDTLTFLGNYKKYGHHPRLKIFNVINSYNAADIENMINFGLEVRADQMEFTVVDTVSGKTDFLALNQANLKDIEEQFARITARATYPDPPGRKHLTGLSPEQIEEHYEVNARFFTDIGDYKNFHYEPTQKVMTCPAGIANREMVHDPFTRCANIFYFDPEICRRCQNLPHCEIDKADFSVKTRFFAVLGFGSFVRRARLSVLQNEGEEALPKQNDIPQTPFVDSMPCTIGWTYSRISTSGDVLPCCKGYGKTMGNLYKNGFKFIWNGGNLMEFRQKAKNFRKSDPYFAIINCYKSCDNIGQNMDIMKQLRRLKPREKAWLEDEVRKMG